MDELDEKHNGDNDHGDAETKTEEETKKEAEQEAEYQRKITDIFGKQIDLTQLDRSID